MDQYGDDSPLDADPLLEDDPDDFDPFPDVEVEGQHSIASSSSQRRAQWKKSWAPWQRLGPKHTFDAFRPKTPFTIVVLLACLKATLFSSGILFLTPLFRLVEDAICHVHYHKDLSEPIEEKECKADEIQSQLAYLLGIGAVIGALVTLVVAFPYGVLADRLGRKPAFFLAYLGILLGFGWAPFVLSVSEQPNLWTLLLGQFFFLIGGGVSAAVNSIYAMASDVSTEENRSTHFLYLSIGGVIAGLGVPLASGFLLQTYGPWVPIKLVFYLSPVVVTAASLLPETLPIKLPDGNSVPEPRRPLAAAIRYYVSSNVAEVASIKALLRNRSLLYCLAAPLISNASSTSHSTTFTQYISKHFAWSLAQTTYVHSPLALCHLLVLVALPRLSAYLLAPRGGRLGLTSFTKDLLLTRISYGVLAGSSVLQALSPSVVPFLLTYALGMLGSATAPLTRAITTAFAERKEHTSRLYALCSIVDTLGSFIGGPVLAWSFSVGMRWGGVLRGLPWLYLAVLYAGAGAAFMMVREPRHAKLPLQTEEGMGYESAAEDDEGLGAR
ncbi:MFS efflux pump atnC like protein [Verticillium longisporum]|nr:MFS efflux pump atnC like protein [Verticillium longisporum]KAG7132886.1 MFS efflux pump atnC like protein [Verticillium longisporum]